MYIWRASQLLIQNRIKAPDSESATKKLSIVRNVLRDTTVFGKGVVDTTVNSTARAIIQKI